MIATDAEIRELLQPALGLIRQIERRPYVYASSYPLEAIDVTGIDGAVVPVLFKNLSSQALSPAGRVAKPRFLVDPRREVRVYRELLPCRNLGTANCYAVVSEHEDGRHWLFLERLTAREMFQVGEFEYWLAAARWLSRLHAGGPGDDSCLISQDAEYYRCWPDLVGVDLPRYDEIIRRMSDISPTLVHGEFYASNVLVQETPHGARVCPVDWETAANGAGLIDLAALTTGSWSEDERRAILGEYRNGLIAGGGRPPSIETMTVQLAWFRLHLALRWLYRPNGWMPPAHQAFDWAAEAQQLAWQLGLGTIKWKGKV
jgi:phosphotransferase family enzyme